MPDPKLHSCVSKVMDQGHDESSAYAICHTSLGASTKEGADYPWDECISDQMSRYGDEETAKRICGSIKAKYGSTFNLVNKYEDGGDLYLKAFLLDSSINKNAWGVIPATLDNNIRSFIGKPYVVQEDFQHPESNDTYDHHLQYQERFAIGRIQDVVNKDGNYSAIIKVTDPAAREAIRLGKFPNYVSPQLWHEEEGKTPQNQMSKWKGTHLAAVLEPAFGISKARLIEQCNGDSNTCLAMLKKASCNFCIKKTIENYQKHLRYGKVDAMIDTSFLNDNETIQNYQKLVTNYKDKTVSSQHSSNQKSARMSEVTNTYSAEDAAKFKDEITSLKAALAEKDNVIAQFKQAKEGLEERVNAIEKQTRNEKIANILSGMTFKTDEERTKKQETLLNSNLAIEQIQDIYSPLVGGQATMAECKKMMGASTESKLPTKSAATVETKTETPYWLRSFQHTIGGSH